MSGGNRSARAPGHALANGVIGAIAAAGLTVAGLIGAEIQSRRQPAAHIAPTAPSRVLVLDPTPWVRPIAADPTLSEQERLTRTQELSDALALAIERELAAGAIILNAQAVQAAPEAAYVRP